MSGDTGSTVLPCGVNLHDLLTHSAGHSTPRPGSHAATCVHCQRAIGELRDVWQPFRHWAERDISTPDTFLSAIVRRVRHIAQAPHHTVALTSRGSTTVTSWVLSLIAAASAAANPAVRVTGTFPGTSPRAATRSGADHVEISEVGGTDIDVALPLTAQSAVRLAELADAVRHDIMAAIRAQTTLVVDSVNIAIDDVDIVP